MPRKINIKQFIEEANLIHQNKYDYSQIIYEKMKIPIRIVCKLHGIFNQAPYHHLSGNGCPKCAVLLNCKTIKLKNSKDFVKKCLNIHGNLYDYSESEYLNSRNKIKIICKIHDGFSQIPNSHLNGNGCPKCTHIISKPETEFLDYIGVKIINRQLNICKRKVDGFIPETNTIYEFLGDYWHGNPKVFIHDSLHPKRKISYGNLFKETEEKLNKTYKEGYQINYIWELDWNNWKNKKLKILPIKKFKGTLI